MVNPKFSLTIAEDMMMVASSPSRITVGTTKYMLRYVHS
jgi:hypothetical protein